MNSGKKKNAASAVNIICAALATVFMVAPDKNVSPDTSDYAIGYSIIGVGALTSIGLRISGNSKQVKAGHLLRNINNL